MRRRWREDYSEGYPWCRLFRGAGLDVGCGDDKLPFEKCQGFDKDDGDANDLTTYFPSETFNYIHASQALEHMVNPRAALNSWLAVTKRLGHIIVTVPDFVLYEQLNWPSKFNPDHRSTWSMTLTGSPAGDNHIHVPTFLAAIPNTRVELCGVVDANYNYALLGTGTDQTLPEDAGVECWIEFVLKKTK